MKSKEKHELKTYLLVLAPLALGRIINTPIMGYYFPFIFSLAFLGFWFWVGMKFYRLSIRKLWALVIGNSLNLISFLMYIWSFYIVSEANRSLLVAGWSQLYPVPTLSISARIYRLTNPEVLTGKYVIISFILMSLVFIAGFFFEAKNSKSKD